MYVPDHLKLRIALARQLKAFYYEDGNSSRNRKRIYRAYGKYLGTTYDTFLNYLKEGKYDLSGIKLAPHIVAARTDQDGLRTALRPTPERLMDASRDRRRGSRRPAQGGRRREAGPEAPHLLIPTGRRPLRPCPFQCKTGPAQGFPQKIGSPFAESGNIAYFWGTFRKDAGVVELARLESE